MHLSGSRNNKLSALYILAVWHKQKINSELLPFLKDF
jgi:hypothetical protein